MGIVAALFWGAFAANGSAVTNAENSKITSQDVKRESKEAAKTTGAYVDQKKDEYVAAMEREYNDLAQRVDALKAKAGEVGRETKAEINEQIGKLEAQKDAVGSKLSELKASSGRAWEDMKDGLNKAMGDLKRSYDRAASHFS